MVDPQNKPKTSNYLYRDNNQFKLHLNVYKNNKFNRSKKVKLTNVIQNDMNELSEILRDDEPIFGARTKQTLNKYF